MRRSSAPSQKGHFQAPFQAPLRAQVTNTPAPLPPAAPTAAAFSKPSVISSAPPKHAAGDGAEGGHGDAGDERGEVSDFRSAPVPAPAPAPAAGPSTVAAGPLRTPGPPARKLGGAGSTAPVSAAAGVPTAAGSAGTFSTPARTRPAAPQEEETPASEKYYSAVWCKVSNKKHKKWEGDCVLVVRGKTVIILDMEGKEIGRNATIRISDLQTLAEGQSLFIGAKEVEIMGTIAPEAYTSGKCFISIAAPVVATNFPRAAPGTSAPMKPVSAARNVPQAPTEIVLTPRFDPQAPNALVMTKPSLSQLQVLGLPKTTPLVDVVVDPYLSQHLRPHQREGVRFLYECLVGFREYAGNGAILADDMGLGKTLQTITLLWTLLKQGFMGRPLVSRAIIVCPSSLVKNWRAEFKKWLGNERLQVFALSDGNTVKQFASATVYSVLIISYEMFLRSIKDLQSVKFDILICDEAHRLKNAAAKTSAAMASLNVKRRVALTGTPVQNDLQEFHAIVEFCNPGVLGSASTFRRIYEDPIVACRQPDATPACRKIGQERAAELNRLISLFCLRRTADVNKKYLPAKEDYVLFCPPSKLQLTLYQHLITSRVVRTYFAVGGAGTKGSRHLVIIGALKKLCNTPALIHQGSEDAENEGDAESIYSEMLPLFPPTFDAAQCGYEDSGKLAVLKNMLLQLRTKTKERVLIVANSTKCLDRIQMMCEDQKFPFLRLEGSTPTAKRIPLVDRFNKGYTDDFVFLLSSKAGGVGLNIVGASRLFLYDIDWNPANDLQAMARIWRDGQKRKVFVYRLITSGTIEEKIFQRQVTKQGLSGAVVDDKSSSTSSKVEFSIEELKDLFSLRENVDCETHDLLNCTCPTNGEVPPQQQQQQKSQGGAHRSHHGDKKDSSDCSMDELMSWKHFSDSQIVEDEVTAAVPKGMIAFVFSTLTAGGAAKSRPTCTTASASAAAAAAAAEDDDLSLSQTDLITADFLNCTSGPSAGDAGDASGVFGDGFGGDSGAASAAEEFDEDEDEVLKPKKKVAKSSTKKTEASPTPKKKRPTGTGKGSESAEGIEGTPTKKRTGKKKLQVGGDEDLLDEDEPVGAKPKGRRKNVPAAIESDDEEEGGSGQREDESGNGDGLSTTYNAVPADDEGGEGEDADMIDLTNSGGATGQAMDMLLGSQRKQKPSRMSLESNLSQGESLDGDFGSILDGILR